MARFALPSIALLLLLSARGANAVLSGVVPEIALFVHLGTHLTQSFWFVAALIMYIWYANTVVAVHRNDRFDEADGPAGLIILLNFVTPSPVLLASFTGLLYARAFQLAPLLDPELWRVYRRYDARDDNDGAASRQPIWVFDSSFWRFAFGAIAAAVGGNFVLLNFTPEVSQAASIGIGVFLLVFGLGLIIYTTYRWLQSPLPSDWLTALSAYLLALYAIAPVFYDFLLAFRPFQGIALQAYLVAVTFVAVYSSRALHASVQRDDDKRAAVRGDVRFTRLDATAGRQWTRWATVWLPIAIVYIVGQIVDNQTLEENNGQDKLAGDAVQVALWVALTQIVLIVVALIIDALRWRQPQYASLKIQGEQPLGAVLGTDADLLESSSRPIAHRRPMRSAAARSPYGGAYMETDVESNADEFDAMHVQRRSARSH